MEKLMYQTPEMEITRFDAEDIIRTSGPTQDEHHYDYETDFMPELGNDLSYGF